MEFPLQYSLDPAIKKTFLEDGVVMMPGLLDTRLMEMIRVVRGSHLGPLYDGTAFDPARPFWGDQYLQLYE